MEGKEERKGHVGKRVDVGAGGDLEGFSEKAL